MKISVKVITGAGKDEVVYDKEKDLYIVRVTTQPEKGKANDKVISLLSEFFDMTKSSVKILSGKKNNKKIIEIERT